MTYWIIHIVIIGLLSYLLFRNLKSDYPLLIFWTALVAKLIAGIILGLIFYDYYGSGDTITFFEMAKSNGSENAENQPRTQFFVEFIRPIVQSSGGSYWITSLWVSFISFVAIWNAVIIFSKLYPKIKILFAASFLFIPSIVFWSSGIMKDAITFAALISIVAVALKFHNGVKLSVRDLLLLLIGAFILLKIKHYIFITSLLFCGILLSNFIFRKTEGTIKWYITLITIVAVFGMTQIIHPYLKVNRIAWTLYENNQAINQKSDSNQLDIVIEDDSWYSVLNEIPRALHAGLLRPSILDKTPVWGWIHKVENLILTMSIFLSLLLYVKLKPKIDWPLFIATSFCILLLATLLPLSTPNFGSLVRYKSTYMPFLFLISSILPYQYFSTKSSE
ncbi:hypothetical protein [Ekhidna sp. To15]|uniref:hypothetical protein n=1 Tax=Ekhidna sp. To15 TaxID=3395267 RepID=UPI003F523106